MDSVFNRDRSCERGRFEPDFADFIQFYSCTYGARVDGWFVSLQARSVPFESGARTLPEVQVLSGELMPLLARQVVML